MSVVVRLIRSEYLVLLLSDVLLVALAPFTSGLLSADNFINILGNLAPLLVVAVGLTIVLIAGGIDLSVTSTIAFASVIGGMVVNGESGWLRDQSMAAPVAILLMVTVGGAHRARQWIGSDETANAGIYGHTDEYDVPLGPGNLDDEIEEHSRPAVHLYNAG